MPDYCQIDRSANRIRAACFARCTRNLALAIGAGACRAVIFLSYRFAGALTRTFGETGTIVFSGFLRSFCSVSEPRLARKVSPTSSNPGTLEPKKESNPQHSAAGSIILLTVLVVLVLLLVRGIQINSQDVTVAGIHLYFMQFLVCGNELNVID